MKTFPEKLKETRQLQNMSITKLASEAGISGRSISFYESGEKYPRQRTIYVLAKILGVSSKYLTDDNCENPLEDIDKDYFLENVNLKYGRIGQQEMLALIDQNRALFAGGTLTQEQKDDYFRAVMTAYLSCREEASRRFSNKPVNRIIPENDGSKPVCDNAVPEDDDN